MNYWSVAAICLREDRRNGDIESHPHRSKKRRGKNGWELIRAVCEWPLVADSAASSEAALLDALNNSKPDRTTPAVIRPTARRLTYYSAE
jgi:hypothetical protein